MSVVAQCADDIVVCMRAVTVTPRGWFESVSNLHVVYKSGLWLNFTDWTEVRLQTLPWTQSWLQFYATTGRLAMWDADTGSGHQSWKFTVTRYEKKTSFFICFLQSFCLNLRGFENPFSTRLPQRNALLGAGEAVQIHVIPKWGDGGIVNNNNNK